MIMVDEVHVWPHARGVFKKGSCHLTTDGALEELHAFAMSIGLRRAWFQNGPTHPHYDLTPKKRQQALQAGAVFVPAKLQARARLDKRKPLVPRLLWRCSNAACNAKEPVEFIDPELGYVLGDREPCVLCLDGCAYVVAEEIK